MRIALTITFVWASILVSELRSQSELARHDGASGSTLGRVLLGIEDQNADGVPDYAAGFPFAVTSAGFGAGRVEIRSGADGSILATHDGTQINARFGSSLATSDLDGDGQAELIVGEPLHAGSAGTASGRVHAIDPLTGTPIWSVEGIAAGERFGTSLLSFGDLDGDGRIDLIVGAPFASGMAGSLAGRISVLDGLTGSQLLSLPGLQAGERLGTVLSAAGDVDRNFYDDFAAGVPDFDGVAGSDSGAVRVYDRTGQLLIAVEGDAAGARLGEAIAGVGDSDSDSFDDLVASMPGRATPGGGAAGRVQLLRGPNLIAGWTIDGSEPNERLGQTLAALGDMNGDRIVDVALGAPLHDGPFFDRGRALVVDPTIGGILFTVTGTESFQRLGSSLAGLLDQNDDGRPDLGIGSPGASANAGAVQTFELNPPLDLDVQSLLTDPGPIQALGADADGDGDRDVIVLTLEGRSVQIFWNGLHTDSGSALARAVFDELPATRIALPPSVTPRSLAARQLDADAPIEILVGHDEGRFSAIDGSGLASSPNFTLLPGPTVLDPRPNAGAITALAIVVHGANNIAVASLEGTISTPGELRVIDDPLGVPVLGMTIASGGNFSSINAGDLDASGDEDLIAANSSTGSDGGVRLFLGANFTAGPATTPLPGQPIFDAVPGSLDPDGLADDVLVAATGLTGGSAVVYRSFIPGSGFAGISNSQGGGAALGVAAFQSTETSRGAAVVDGQRSLSLLSAWNGSSFTTSTGWPIGEGAVDVSSAELYAPGPAPLCVEPELLVALRRENTVRILRRQVASALIPVPGSGCSGLPNPTVMSFSGSPTIGNASWAIQLTQATPQQPLLLVAVPVTGPAGTIGVFPGFCGLINYTSGPFFTFPDNGTFLSTGPAGSFTLPVPIPDDPSLCRLEYAIQWGVLDGGPLLGFTVSNAFIVRFGET